MGALNPAFLAAVAALGIPLFLHLFQRHQVRRISFPALRYLERTEREHARQIRFRQLLLLVVRLAILMLLVGAGARLYVSGRGSSHPPTAVVIVLDNSMSSGMVVGEERVLDEFKSIALRALDRAGAEDRFWVVRVGEPWLPALPGNAADARLAIDEIEVSDARGDVEEALARAGELAATSELEHREILLLSDLQATGFPPIGRAPAGDVPVVVWAPDRDGTPNHGLDRVLVGGGLPPLRGQRTEVTVRALPSEGDTTRLPVRLVMDDRIRGAASVPPGAEAAMAISPSGGGWLRGYAETDPDALRADDRRYFAFRSRAAPRVAIAGEPDIFVREALAVLEMAGRVSLTALANAELVVAGSGEGLADTPATGAILVLPPADVTLLPALNRRLADAGIPWRYAARRVTGEADIEGRDVPQPLAGVRVASWYELVLSADPGAPTRTLAEAGGAPWLVQGTDAIGRRHLLLASPLDAASTSLPVSTGMLGFIDWVSTEWGGIAGGLVERIAGLPLPAPSSATHVRFPSGAEFLIDGTRTVRATGEVGFYTFLAGDSVVSIAAVNPPPSESRMDRIDLGATDAFIGPEAILADDESSWDRDVYRARQGPEVWWPFLVAALVFLAVEALLAASGSARAKSPSVRPNDPAAVPETVA